MKSTEIKDHTSFSGLLFDYYWLAGTSEQVVVWA
jgi:hypothetical protein